MLRNEIKSIKEVFMKNSGIEIKPEQQSILIGGPDVKLAKIEAPVSPSSLRGFVSHLLKKDQFPVSKQDNLKLNEIQEIYDNIKQDFLDEKSV